MKIFNIYLIISYEAPKVTRGPSVTTVVTTAAVTTNLKFQEHVEPLEQVITNVDLDQVLFLL